MRRLLLAPLNLLPTLVRHRFLLGQLAWRAFSARHAGSYLGWLWTPLSTGIQFALFLVVFSAILEIKVEGLGIDLARRPDVGFGVFLMTGLVPFLALNDAVLRAARVFRSHVTLVQRVRFPSEVLVVGDVLGILMHHGLALVMVVAYCAVTGHVTVASLPWMALGVVLAALWIVGLTLVVSVLGAFLPDVAEVIAVGLQIAFYAAPIVYPLSLIKHELLVAVVQLNPLTQLVGVIRAGLIGASPPPLAVVAAMVVAGVALVAVGAAAVDRWRASIPDAL